MKKVILCLVLVLSLAFTPALASSSYKVMKVIVSGAYIRKGPGNYDIMDMLKRDSRVLLLEKTTHAYYKIATPKGEIGYIFRDHVVETGTVSKSSVFRATEGVNIRKKPSTHASKRGKLTAGEYVRVLEEADGWSYVMTISGKTGYVKSEFLVK